MTAAATDLFHGGLYTCICDATRGSNNYTSQRFECVDESTVSWCSYIVAILVASLRASLAWRFGPAQLVGASPTLVRRRPPRSISMSLVKYRLPNWIRIVGFTPSLVLRSSTRTLAGLLLCPFQLHLLVE